VSTMNPQGLQISGLYKSYGQEAVLRGLDLHVPAGAITCLLGRNGAGKTTTMSCVLGLRKADAGQIFLDGEVLTGDDNQMRAFGFMPEDPALYDHLTGQEFLEFVGELYGVDRDRIHWIDQRLASLDLLEDRDRMIRDYSMGTKRKISFLAAMIHDPEVLVLDEPTGSLDAASARVLKDELITAKERGRVILFSTHVMELAERISDHVAIIHDGVIVVEGTPKDLIAGHRAARSLEDVFLHVTKSAPVPMSAIR
jgi:ABC-2 type transport system ATP-binding protein